MMGFLFQITPSLAKVLLHTHEWTVAPIVLEYRRDAKHLLVSSKINPPNPPDNSLNFTSYSSRIACSVCVVPSFSDKFSSLSCGHSFCNHCWAMHFEVQISQGISTGS